MTVLDIRKPGSREAAPGIETVDVAAVNAKKTRTLYAGRQNIYPKLAHGIFRNTKWLVMLVTLGIYYALPWIRWDRGPEVPNQAVLIDFANGRIFLGPIELWPQELFYVTGLLVIAALGLFLVTSIAGRVWCGYTCPQTVWTDLMIAVERFWQGDRNARIRLDKEPWGVSKIFKKTMTHLSWMVIGVLTGGALVFYFRDAPTLMNEFLTGSAPAISYLFLGIFAATTYLLGGLAREQVCIYMCPWPRIQGAMTDRHTLLVSYKPERGEQRGPARKQPDGTIDWSVRGDCIDIRDGSQLECIQCALCIDACNDIMDKIKRPRNLIAYDTVSKREASARGEHEPFQLVRMRTILYAALIAVVCAFMAYSLAGRTTLEVNVLRDRGVMFVPLSDGGIRNGYTVKILNKTAKPRVVGLSIEGLPGASLRLSGGDTGATTVTVPTDNLRELRAFVTVPRDGVAKLTPPSTQFEFIVTADGDKSSRRAIFQSPAGKRP